MIALPILCPLFLVFAFRANIQRDVAPDNSRVIQLAGDADTVIQEEKVSADYLKLLEGTYVTAKESPVFRRIRITEVLGGLMAKDQDYRYRLVFVGNEKFINTDDGVPLIFNSKSRNEITLLIFGTTLTKVDAPKEPANPKKSVAYAVADVVAKNNIDAAVRHYQEIKNAAGYDLNETEIAFVGDRLLQMGKANEAAAIFKLAVESFPNSFKIYTAYGNALLALGNKAQAIENYKRSVQLNPGSKDALKKLNQLGISSEEVIKKVTVPMEELKLMEGYYLSTNEIWGMRIIKVRIEDGELTGTDGRYHYKLIPVGEGKFINPDDGQSLIFNTKNRSAVTLLLFEKIELKKLDVTVEKEVTIADVVKKVDVSADYLKILEGVYISSDDPHSERKITFVQENGQLAGTDNGYHYKLISIGEGKFINPDDGALLAFDTKSKSAVNLLLFGSIHLSKIK